MPPPDLARARLDAVYWSTFHDPDKGKQLMPELTALYPEAAAWIRKRCRQSQLDLKNRVLLGPERYTTFK